MPDLSGVEARLVTQWPDYAAQGLAGMVKRRQDL